MDIANINDFVTFINDECISYETKKSIVKQITNTHITTTKFYDFVCVHIEMFSDSYEDFMTTIRRILDTCDASIFIFRKNLENNLDM